MRLARYIYDFVEMLIFALVITMVTFMFLGRLTVVDGPSMMNTLIDGEVLAVKAGISVIPLSSALSRPRDRP